MLLSILKNKAETLNNKKIIIMDQILLQNVVFTNYKEIQIQRWERSWDQNGTGSS